MKVLIIGGFPPPYGGITVHIHRLYNYLRSEKIDCTVINQHGDKSQNRFDNENIITLNGNKLRKLIKIKQILSNNKYDIIHFHTSQFGNFILGGFFLLNMLKNGKKVITIHSGSFVKKYFQKSFTFRLQIRMILNKFDHFIAVNPEQHSFYIKELKKNNNLVSLIPTFLYPQNNFEIEHGDRIIKSIIELKANVDFVVLVSGYIYKYYGFHYVIKSVNDLMKMKNVKIGIVFVFYASYEKNYKKLLMEMISNYDYTIVFNNLDPNCFLEVLKKCDILIRPTLIDSFGVTVAEAIYLDIPVIASDVCERQDGTVLFKTGNEQDLTDKLGYVIENYKQVKSEVIMKKPFCNANKIKDVYSNLL